MQEYETVYVLQPDLPSERQKKISEKVQKILKDNKAKVLEQKEWGKRKLAYSIGKFEHGHYLYLNYTGDGSFISDLERTLKLDENILRFLTIKRLPQKVTGKSKQPKKITQPDDMGPGAESKGAVEAGSSRSSRFGFEKGGYHA